MWTGFSFLCYQILYFFTTSPAVILLDIQQISLLYGHNLDNTVKTVLMLLNIKLR